MLEVGRLLPRQSGWLFAEHDRVRTRLRFVLPHMPLDGPINSSTSPSDATHDVRCTGTGVQDICPRRRHRGSCSFRAVFHAWDASAAASNIVTASGCSATAAHP